MKYAMFRGLAALLAGIAALTLIVGGAWLIFEGGSWYYLIAGLLFAITSFLLISRRPGALWVYAALVAGTLIWSLWEVGLDWWPLSARGGIIFIFGLLLLIPWICRQPNSRDHGSSTPARLDRSGRLALSGTLLASLLVAVASWFTDPHRVEGTVSRNPDSVSDDAVPAGSWHAYGRTNFGQRFSPLTQIDASNVDRLEVAWTYRTGDMPQPGDPLETTFQVTPLKIGNRLFLCTPHQSVIALDADTGGEIWRYDPQIRDKLALQHLTCRGLSYHAAEPETADSNTSRENAPARQSADTPVEVPPATTGGPTKENCPEKLFMPTADGRLIALDPASGAVCTGFGDEGQVNLWGNMPYPNPGGYYSTSPVVVTRDLVIVGGTVLDNVSTKEASGVIRAYDVNTGALLWNWDSGNPDATKPIGQGETYTPNSPNSWSISSVDEALGLVYIPLGNQPPDQWGGNRSPSVERFSSSVVALDIATGQVRWVFQTVHHDLWDYDVPSQPTLIDLTIDGEPVPALVQPTKQGEIYVLDRRTGEPILPVTEAPVPQGAAEGDHTAATQPVSRLSFDPAPLRGADMWGLSLFDQMVCRINFQRLRYEGRYTPPSTEGTLVYPGNFGVFNWGGIAVDPQRDIAFVTPTYLAFVSKLVPRQDDTTFYVQGENRPAGSLPALNENFGAPFAVQLSAFTSFLGLPCQAPPWGYIAAADLRSGDVVWQHKNGTVRDRSPLPLPFRMGVPNLGGPIMTAGGVAFLTGTLDYYVRAYDVADGRQLWRSRLPAGGQATPMTYEGSDGRQYLLVIAGGHGSLGTKAGDYVIAYALPR